MYLHVNYEKHLFKIACYPSCISQLTEKMYYHVMKLHINSLLIFISQP